MFDEHEWLGILSSRRSKTARVFQVACLVINCLVIVLVNAAACAGLLVAWDIIIPGNPSILDSLATSIVAVPFAFFVTSVIRAVGKLTSCNTCNADQPQEGEPPDSDKQSDTNVDKKINKNRLVEYLKIIYFNRPHTCL